jgi:uncharacterized protein YbjT (DUF2867 family)
VPAYVVVNVVPRAGAKRDRRGPVVLRRDDVAKLLAEHDARLIASAAPEVAGEDQPASATIAVPDMARANKLASALRGIDGIETAYAKPGEELP